MPRACTVCAHAERAAIDHLLVGGGAYRDIAGRFGLTKSAVERHKAEHLPEALVRARAAEETAEAVDLMAELRALSRRVNLLFDACDRYLRDADDPERYDIGPRADDVTVTYTAAGDEGERPTRRKARLSDLLARLEADGGFTVERAEWRHADPRELILKTADRLQGQLELLAKLLGQLDDRPQINLLVAPEWLAVRAALLAALAPYPAARVAVAGELARLEGV